MKQFMLGPLGSGFSAPKGPVLPCSPASGRRQKMEGLVQLGMKALRDPPSKGHPTSRVCGRGFCPGS